MTSEQIIRHVKNYPVLYDKQHPNFKDNDYKDRIWNEIGCQLGEDEDSVKKKWKNIKDCYGKYLRSLEARSKQSLRYRKWQWAGLMEFFAPYLPFSQNVSIKHESRDISKTEQSYQSEENDDRDFIPGERHKLVKKRKMKYNSRGRPDKKVAKLSNMKNRRTTSLEIKNLKDINEEANETKRRRSNTDCDIRNEANKLNNYFGKLRTSTCHDYDGTDLIFLGYAKTIKKFSLERQAKIKGHLAEIIMENEIEHVQEQEINSIEPQVVFLENSTSLQRSYKSEYEETTELDELSNSLE